MDLEDKMRSGAQFRVDEECEQDGSFGRLSFLTLKS